jgi:hypothetical protein
MTRDELLHLASQWLFSKTSTRDLAARMTSSEAVERERTMATAMMDKYNRVGAAAWVFFVTCVVCIIVGVVAMLLWGYLPQAVSDAGALVAASGFVLAFVSAARGAAAGDKVDDAKATLSNLTLVVKSSDCKTALELVAGGQPAVLAWRDLAIAERGVLCAFDVQMMHELHHASKAASKAAAAQRENEQACRQLYGKADVSSAPATGV